MRFRRWCVAWDGTPFVIVMDSRHFTKRGAEWSLRFSRSPRSYVTTVADAERTNELVQRLLHRGVMAPMPDNRFEAEAMATEDVTT